MTRLEAIKRIQVLTARQEYALEKENIDYYQELLEERETCLEAIRLYNKETNTLMTEEEHNLIEQIKNKDNENKEKLEKQLEQVKMKLREIRINEARDNQYIQGYGGFQASGMFFDKKGY